MLRWLLKIVSPMYVWRLECPQTVEAVAEHFIHHHLGDDAIQLISSLPTANSETSANTELAWKRRISFIYGVATHYDVPGLEPGRVGWNRRLFDDCRAEEPERAVEEIYHRVWEKARESSVQRRNF